MSYTVRPISDRTPFTGRHRDSPFRSTWSATEELLIREVAALRGRNFVVEIDVSESQIRLDGRLYARAQASSPAVRVAFESTHGPLTYATDRFWTWQDNLRAIALGLEALRKVDRYGITERGEQYAGFKALPVGRAMPASHMTSGEALTLLREVASEVDADWSVEQLFRRARIDAHPDKHGGDHALAYRVDEAGRVLGVR